MTTNFPTSLDSFTNPTSGDNLGTSVGGRTHSQLHSDIADAVEALEARVGITGSADAVSLTKRIAVLEAAGVTYPPTILGQLGVVSIYDRLLTAGAQALSSQLPFLTGFIAPKSMTVSNITVFNVTGTGTATSAYLALYSLASNGDATLVCSSASTTGLFSATGLRTAAMTSPAAITGGNAYAVYVYYNGAFTPQLQAGTTTNETFTHARKQPYVGVLRGASTTAAPPASLTYASGTAVNSGPYYAELS